MSTLHSPYPAVEAWCAFIHSEPAYTALQVDQAIRDNAPPLAIYYKRIMAGPAAGTRRWMTLDNVRSEPARFFFWDHYPELARQAWEDDS